jgi:hypothetical protein
MRPLHASHNHQLLAESSKSDTSTGFITITNVAPPDYQRIADQSERSFRRSRRPFLEYVVAVGVALTRDLPPWEGDPETAHRPGHFDVQQPNASSFHSPEILISGCRTSRSARTGFLVGTTIMVD